MPDIQPLLELAVSDRDITLLKNACVKLDTMIKSCREELDQRLQEKDTKMEELQQIEEARKLETQVPNIRNQKEYVASKKQLEEARKGRGQSEEMLLEMDIKMEELNTILENLETVIKDLESSYHDVADPLIENKEENQAKIVQISTNHSDLVDSLPKMIKRFYDKCTVNQMHQPICFIVDKSCSGCNMLVQPQLVNELMVNPNSYKTCPHCSRILVYQPPVEEESGAA
jgi:predicted  nucleic acid-binding Zn-ribbon protein